VFTVEYRYRVQRKCIKIKYAIHYIYKILNKGYLYTFYAKNTFTNMQIMTKIYRISNIDDLY